MAEKAEKEMFAAKSALNIHDSIADVYGIYQNTKETREYFWAIEFGNWQLGSMVEVG